jgi:hypothetical protein
MVGECRLYLDELCIYWMLLILFIYTYIKICLYVFGFLCHCYYFVFSYPDFAKFVQKRITAALSFFSFFV